MLRFIFLTILVLVVVFILLKGQLNSTNNELPVFLREDHIANQHQTKIQVKLNSIYRPDSTQLATLKKDYSNLWAHLNHLYQTNQVEVGKEYYTEDFFKHINLHNEGKVDPIVTRRDISHIIEIQNWAWDGLVCTLTDSVHIAYTYPNNTKQSVRTTLAVVLLYQGDHWRIDGLRYVPKKS